MLALSGGHPGLLVALCDLLSNGRPAPADADLVEWALAQPPVVEECRKLWAGLAQDEQLGLSRLAQDIGTTHAIHESLTLKGLIEVINPDAIRFFSPVFRAYVLDKGTLSDRGLWLDEGAAVVWVENRCISDLSPLEFELLRLLHRRLNQVCSRDEISAVLYPDEQDSGSDNRIDSLVRHLRRAIEPAPDHPRYLLTVRGRGYKLVGHPGT